MFPGSTYEKLTDSSSGAVILTESYSQLASGALVTEAVIEAQGKKLRCKQVPNPALHAVLNSTHSHDDTQGHDMQIHAIQHQARCFWGLLAAFVVPKHAKFRPFAGI